MPQQSMKQYFLCVFIVAVECLENRAYNLRYAQKFDYGP